MPLQVLVGAVTRADPEVLKAHLKTVFWQEAEDVEADVVYIPDPTCSDETLQVLTDHGVKLLAPDEKPEEAQYAVAEETHHWSKATFYWLGQQKQKLIELARRDLYDALLLVDSDLLLAPDTLRSLLSTQKPVVSAVFWTRWQPNAPPLPNVWLTHPYEFQGRGIEAHDFLSSLAERQLVKVGGLGACTLIRAEALDKVAFWPPVVGLPEHAMWQGEDRHFCITAERNRVELWADAWPDVFHCYRPSDVQHAGEWLERLRQPHAAQPRVGDYVDLTLEPCEEPQLVGFSERLRGRLGSLRLLPDLEHALARLEVGQEAFVRVKFPPWYPIGPYQQQTKVIRIRLNGVKPYAFAPTLEDAYRARGTRSWDSLYEAASDAEVHASDIQPAVVAG